MTIDNGKRPAIPLMLIGAGGFGGYHLTSINNLCREGRIQLVAVADPALGKMPQLKAELEGRNVRLYSDYKQMLECEDNCNVVTIAAPIPFHYEIAEACIERELLIYLEKPPVPLIAQLERLVQLDKHKRVYVGFQHLYYEWMHQLKSWIGDGRFGELRSIRACGCWNRTDVYYQRSAWSGKMMFLGRPVFDGPATNALAHLIHSIMYLASPVSGGFLVPSEIRGELYRARRIESYDVASLSGKFHSGPEFSFSVTHATQREHPFCLSIVGSKGWAKVSSNGELMETSFSSPEVQNEPAEVLRKSYCAFADFVEGRRERRLTTLADCRGYTIATNGMLLSSGGIHEIPEDDIRMYNVDGKRGYSVPCLADAIMQTLEHGGTLSDKDVPWGIATSAVQAECITTADVLACMAPVNGRLAHERGELEMKSR